MKMLTLIEKDAPWKGEGGKHIVVNLPKHVLQRFPRSFPSWDDMIYWTENATYCLIAAEERSPWQHPELGNVSLLSVNGGGEIRWRVSTCMGKDDKLAVEAYGLVERT